MLKANEDASKGKQEPYHFSVSLKALLHFINTEGVKY